MKITWAAWTHGTGWNGEIGRIGKAVVAYRARRAKDDLPSQTPYQASVFGLRHECGFAELLAAKQWCERTAERLLHEALHQGEP